LTPGTKSEPQLAHVLFMDIVGCSKLPTDEQKRIVGRLQELVRESVEFQRSRETDQLISLPTGDGMALVFFNKLDAAVLCAVEITKAIQAESLCRIRMGVNTGPVFVMDDINGKRNVSGAGINRAERVMSCGGDAHILLSDSAAESLRQLSGWQDKIHDVGECQVKDGWIRISNFVDGPVGNPSLPRKLKRYVHRRRYIVAASVAGVVASALFAGAFWMRPGPRGSPQVPGTPSIAVLPFMDMSPEKNQEYFSDGLAEELLNGLARIPGLRVAARTSSFQFKGKTDDCRTIGEKLSVATLLEGSVRRQGNRARIAVQLIQAADGFDLWSETFDREMTDILAVQQEIARAVTAALKVRLLREQPATQHARNTNADAYNAYLQGKYFLQRSNKENLEKAAGYFEQAIGLDAEYAAAWVGLGKCRQGQAGAAYIAVEEGFRKARDAIERALALDPNLGEAYAALGTIKMFHDWDWAGADAAYRRALALAPSNADVIRSSAAGFRVLGRWSEALELSRRVTEIDPLSSGGYYLAGIVLLYAGRPEEATTALKKTLELAPERAMIHSYLGQVYVGQSRGEEALREMEKEKDPAFRLCGLAVAYHALGRKKESDANLAQLIANFRSGAPQGDVPYQISQVYAFRGEADHAFEWLNRAYAERDAGLSELKGDPLLANIRQDPRYTALLKKMRLPV
jgi:TolB-like protein/class 3 adenylate cyclase/Flp pilus assembly protein TadD